jgi:hypothetical protein
VREQRVALKHHSDIAFIRPHRHEVLVVELDRTRARVFEPGNQERRGLPRAVWSEECDEFSARDVDARIVDCVGLAS